MGEPRRWFIGAATTTYTTEYREARSEDDRPELRNELERMRELFSGLGYLLVPGFKADLDRDDFRALLRSFLTDADRTEDDTVVVYYTGHGVMDGAELLLPMADATGDAEFTSLPAAELTGRLISGGAVKVRRLLVLLDTCYAGGAMEGFAGGAIGFLNRLRVPKTPPSIGLVVAARPREQAESGAFTRAFADAVENRASGGHETDFLPLDGIVGIINDSTPEWQHARHFLTGDTVTQFLPNPRLDRWLRDLDLRTQARHRLRERRDSERLDHVLPRAQGLDSAEHEDVWLFTGREAALAAAVGWLTDPTAPATLVVTGDPGSGKSSLLARLAVLADPRLRARVPHLDDLPETTVPPTRSISRFVHARGLTGEEILAGLCEATRAEETTSPGRLLAELRSRDGDPVVVVVDAIDEAIGDRLGQAQGRNPVVDEVLAPLISAAGRTPLRLMIGTRRHLLEPLGIPAHTDAVRLIDLDDETYADVASVRRYVEACLLQLTEQSPYRHRPRAYIDAVCDAVAAAADRSFLVALITARSLALTPELVDPFDPRWRKQLPTKAADAMREDLDRRLGDEAQRARDLLLPLAYAHGSGLPWEDVWPQLARELTGKSYRNSDLDWLVEQAGYYITEATADAGRRSVYRLYHESLAEHLRATRDDPIADEATVSAALTAATSRLVNGYPDWDRAHPYTRANLATHAAQGSCLDPLLDDPHYLLAATPAPLLAALSAATTRRGKAAADAYRRASTRLRYRPPEDRPAYLQLAARCARAPELADAITTADLPLTWTTAWASWRLQPTHLSIAVGQPVLAVGLGQLDGRPVVVSGSNDATVRIWDAATGAPVGDPFTGHTDWVNAVGFGQLDGRPVIISAGDDGAVRLHAVGRGKGEGELSDAGLYIDMASALGAVAVSGSRVSIGSELGVVCLRLPLDHA